MPYFAFALSSMWNQRGPLCSMCKFYLAYKKPSISYTIQRNHWIHFGLLPVRFLSDHVKNAITCQQVSDGHPESNARNMIPPEGSSDHGPQAPSSQTSEGVAPASVGGDVVVVTGGCGFLGQHIVKLLQTRATHVKEVRILDLKPFTQRLGELTFDRSLSIGHSCFYRGGMA